MKINRLASSTRQGLFLAALILRTTLTLCAADYDSDIKKTFAVKPGGEVVLDVDSGSVDVTTTDASEVKVEVKRRVNRARETEAQAIFKAHEVHFDQDGDQVRVTAKFNQNANRLLNRGRIHFRVEYLIQVPRQFNLNLQTAAGSIAVSDIEGTVKAKTAGGNLKFGSIKGPLDANTAAGSVSAEHVTGKAEIKSSGGNINLGRLEGDTTADTAAGSIAVKEAKSKLALKSNGGNIDLGEIAGPAALSTAAGSIRVKSASAAIRAKTAGGNINIEEARETVEARTAAGSITVGLSAQPKGDCNLSTAGGNIEVRLAEKLALDVNAHTRGGRVTSDLPVTPTPHKASDTLNGKLNGGGVGLVLETSAGNIALRKAK